MFGSPPEQAHYNHRVKTSSIFFVRITNSGIHDGNVALEISLIGVHRPYAMECAGRRGL
jgi:hypothetical protein